MNINQIDGTSEKVLEILVKSRISEIEQKSDCKIKIGGKEEANVHEHKELTASGAKLLYVEFINPERENPIKIVVTYTPTNDGDVIMHLNEKNRMDKLLLKYYKTHDSKYLPCPFGSGGEVPTTHHWSEYAGSRIDCLSDASINTDKVTAMLATALTAKKDTIEEILGKHFAAADLAAQKKFDAIQFEEANAIYVLQTYLCDAEHKLGRALANYTEIANLIVKNIERANNNQDSKGAVEQLKDDANNISMRITGLNATCADIASLKASLETQKFDYKPEEFVMLHPDLNLDNILVDKDTYEVSFIDGTLREGQTLESYFGPKQVYYFIFKNTAERVRKRSADPGNPTRESDTYLLGVLDKLEQILKKDYQISDKDCIIKKVINTYFIAFDTKKESEKIYKKYIGDNKYNVKEAAKTNIQSTLETSTEKMPEV